MRANFLSLSSSFVVNVVATFAAAQGSQVTNVVDQQGVDLAQIATIRRNISVERRGFGRRITRTSPGCGNSRGAVPPPGLSVR